MNINTGDYQPVYLEDLGWNAFFQDNYQVLKIPDSVPARVVSQSKGAFQVYCKYGEFSATVSGKMRYQAGEEYKDPAVGDWVIIKPLVDERKGIISAILPRKSKFSRKSAGDRSAEQIISANIDTVFIVNGLDGGRNFNLRRIERYLTLAWSSGAVPVIVLNKIDLCPDVNSRIRSVESIAPGVSVHPVSAREKTGLDALKSYLVKGSTAAFLGSSGVGKSALINALLGENRQETGEIRADDHEGRHTTTRRELILLPEGGMVIDTPGMREIQLWAGEEDLQGAFQDIESLAEGCRFSNCTHNAEPGCAVRSAIENGQFDPARMESYRKLQNELKYMAAKEEGSTRQFEKQRFKKIAKWVKELKNQP
jgi:ribosome biogenesis GTPase / thiamine phosphate phosphatase